MQTLEFEHVPVLLSRVLENLALKDNAVIVDGTLGLGGYSEAFLKANNTWRVLGIDRDKKARELATKRLEVFGDRFKALAGDFRDMKALCSDIGVFAVDAVVLDLGVSNMQLVDDVRGFSFKHDGPLDMRMDRENCRTTAADIVNTYSREDLTEVFRKYGEERFAWKIAGEIVKSRTAKPFATTAELTEAVRRALPAPVMRKMSGHPARKVFQALRIKVNDELGALEGGLKNAFELLSQEGMLIVVTYHSLEDRIVKRQFKDWCTDGCGVLSPRRSVVPDECEIERNPKSRSARLRGFQKKEIKVSEGRLGPWRRY